MKTKLLAGLVTILIGDAAFADLTGQIKSNWVASYVPVCYKNQKEMVENRNNSDESLSKYCTCLAFKTSESSLINNELIVNVEKKEATLSPNLTPSVTPFCKANFAQYNSGAIENTKPSSDGNGLFNGKTKRFTAFRQIVSTKEWVTLEKNELPNGKLIFDINIQVGRQENSATDVITGVTYQLSQIKELTAYAKTAGYDFQFATAESGPLLTFNTAKNLLTTDYLNPQDGKMYQTHYVNSQALVCNTLKVAKSKAQGVMAASLLKEALMIAIRSYAGTSYSGGTFSGSNSAGTAISGTYQQYNNSWLGDHYSRGLDAVFSGMASAGQIDDELQRLKCE